MATATNDKPVRLGDLPVVKTNILENARQYDKGVVGGYNGTFPLTAASQGGIYLLPSTGKFYVCETAYNGAQISAPNSNFVELSVWKNHDRLANLFKKYDILSNVTTTTECDFTRYDIIIAQAVIYGAIVDTQIWFPVSGPVSFTTLKDNLLEIAYSLYPDKITINKIIGNATLILQGIKF